MPNQKERAGWYKQQDEGYETYVPKKLPPEPELEIDGELLSLMSKADRALGRLDGTVSVLPNPDLFVTMYIRKEAILSSQIEGTQASLIDVLEYEANILDPNISDDTYEVINYTKAMNYGLKQIQNRKRIDINLMKEIHNILLKDTRGGERKPGKLRSTQNWIGQEGCSISEAMFVPPSVKDMKKALKELEYFINSDNSLPPLIKVGLVHAQFETIHPFLDGNGRIGRLLITFILTMNDYLTKPLLYLSHYLKQNRLEYYDRLQSIRDKGDWEGWLKFFLKGVYNISTDSTKISLKILGLKKKHYDMIMDRLGKQSGNGVLLLNSLFKQPLVNVNNVCDIMDISYPNANKLVSKFENLGILKEITGQARNRVFEYMDYLDLLE
ncbi:MAG: Fic family protein [Thermoplasmata archaeon]